jgi:hypothetical protein
MGTHTALGEFWIPPVYERSTPLPAGDPPVLLLVGRRWALPFRRSAWHAPKKGVISSYREDRPTWSHHMKRLSNDIFMIDHVDEVNPDYDPVGHFFADTTFGKIVKGAVVGAAVGFGIGLILEALT